MAKSKRENHRDKKFKKAWDQTNENLGRKSNRVKRGPKPNHKAKKK